MHLLALADDVAEPELPFELLFEQEVLTDQVAAFDRTLEHLQQRIGLDWLFHETMGPRFHRLNRLDDTPVAGHDNDLGVGVNLFEFAEQLETVGVGQQHVGHDYIRLPGLEDLLPARPDHRSTHFVALVFEEDLEPLDHRRFIVDSEHAVPFLHRHRVTPRRPPLKSERPSLPGDCPLGLVNSPAAAAALIHTQPPRFLGNKYTQ